MSTENLFATWRAPLSFTALIPVDPVTEGAVRTVLESQREAIEAAVAAVGDLHSFRLVLVPTAAPGLRQPHVLFNVVHDHPIAEHLAALVLCVGGPLAALFIAGGLPVAPAELPALLQRHRIRENTLHLGAIRRTVADIRAEQALREEIGALVDRALAEGRWQAETPAETIRREIRDHFLAAGREDLPAGPAPSLTRIGRILRGFDLLRTFAFPAIGVLSTDIARAIQQISNRAQRDLARVGYRLWWVYCAIPTGVALVSVRLIEWIERDVPLPPADAAKVARLEAVEDLRLKNEVTYWFAVRDSWFRRLLLHVILWGSERGCRHFWTHGALAGIDTIHYARILQLARGRVMLFMSDYDGSLDRYLMDFLGAGSRAVIPIASNVAGCPKTRWLFGRDDPVSFGGRLHTLLRTYQLETAVWFNAYPLLSVRDVRINGAIRDGLFAPAMAEVDAEAWAEML